MYKSRAPKDESDGRLSNTERVKNLSKSRRNIQKSYSQLERFVLHNSNP